MHPMPDRLIGGFASLQEAAAYAACFPDRGMTFFDGVGQQHVFLSYARLWQMARQLAEYLRRSKPLPAGARIGLIAQTGPDFIAHFLACQLLGWIPCPLPLPFALQGNARYQRVLQGMLDAAGMSLLMAPQSMLALLKMDALQTLFPCLAYEAAIEAIEGLTDQIYEFPSVAPSPRDIAYVQFSSGSTAQPKGIAISHRALMINIDDILRAGMQLHTSDRAFSWLPFYHDMGLVGMLLAPLCAQVCVDYLAPSAFVRRPYLWPRLMGRRASTITYAPAFGYALAASRSAVEDDASLNLQFLRVAGVGGDRIIPSQLQAFALRYAKAGFHSDAFRPSYGLAEATLAVTVCDLPWAQAHRHFLVDYAGLVTYAEAGKGDVAREFVNCGKPLPSWEVLVRDAHGESLPHGAMGDVVVRGSAQMSGTFEQGHLQLVEPADGVATGDVGFLSVDGDLFITGRRKDVMIVRGRNVWPQDVEQAVAEILNSQVDDILLFQDQEAPPESDLFLLVHEKAVRQSAQQNAHEAIASRAASLLGAIPVVHVVTNGSIERTSSGKKARAATREQFLNGTIMKLPALFH